MKLFKDIFLKQFSIMIAILGNVLIASELQEREEERTVSAEVTVPASLSLSVDIDHGYATLDTVFGRVITLGSFCLTKGQVNAYFSPRSPWMTTKKGHADLFDWLWIPNYNKFAQALKNKLEDLFKREDFDIHSATANPNIVIMNRKYQMFWNHLFENHTGAYNDKNTRITTLTEEKLDEVFPFIDQKINYLKDKFLAARIYNTLYVIAGKTDGLELNLATLLQVRDGLTAARDGNKQFCLLYVSDSPTCESTENIIVRTAHNLHSGWDGADPVRWKEILDEFHFAPDIWA